MGLLKLVAWRVAYLLGVACDELSRAQIGFLLGKVSHWAGNIFGPSLRFFWASTMSNEGWRFSRYFWHSKSKMSNEYFIIF